jgi:putative flippase GtrA
VYERFRQLIHEGAKFGVVGGIGFLVTDGGTNLLKSTLHGWLKANVIATVAGMIVTYFGSRYWTFRHRERGGMGRETVLFVVLNGMGLGIQLACLGLTNYALGLTDRFSANVALFLGICLGTLFRFWSYRKWVWIAPTAGPPLDPAEVAAADLSHAQSRAAASRSAPQSPGYPRQAGLRRATQEQDATRDGLGAKPTDEPIARPIRASLTDPAVVGNDQVS